MLKNDILATQINCFCLWNSILLLETPCPLVRPFVRSSRHVTHFGVLGLLWGAWGGQNLQGGGRAFPTPKKFKKKNPWLSFGHKNILRGVVRVFFDFTLLSPHPSHRIDAYRDFHPIPNPTHPHSFWTFKPVYTEAFKPVSDSPW